MLTTMLVIVNFATKFRWYLINFFFDPQNNHYVSTESGFKRVRTIFSEFPYLPYKKNLKISVDIFNKE